MLNEKWNALGDWSPLAALQRVSETKWLVDGIIPAGSINWMVAAPSSFKTFLALDMATCVASGRPWHGRETDQAVVLYIAGEGDDDIHVRRAAADLAAGDTGPMLIVQIRPRLDEPQGLATLLALVNDVTYDGRGGGAIDFPEIQSYYANSMNGYLTEDERTEFDFLDETSAGDDARKYGLRLSRPRFSVWDEAIAQVFEDMNLQMPGGVPRAIARNVLVVIDTYSQTSADDTKATVSRYVKTLRDLQEKAAAAGGTVTVLVVDHTTKGGDTYMGSLAKLGDSDTMIEVDRRGQDSSVTLTSAKMRSGASFEPVHLDLTPFMLDGFTDALGRTLTSLVVTDGEHGHRIRKAAGTNGDTAAALVLSLLTESGASAKGDLKKEFLAHKSNEGKNAESTARAFNRALTTLLESGVVRIDSDSVVSRSDGGVEV
ncbi:AAA family ATPase [Massilia sp. PWRC2]|uniref:AAA family ATPase n=1 Tax=Massilia sp. PWRC2 TaxID=2804626 RepID=UPI003CF58B93